MLLSHHNRSLIRRQPKACYNSKTALCAGTIKYDDAQKALEQGGFNLSRPEMQQLVSQLVDEMDEQGDIQ